MKQVMIELMLYAGLFVKPRNSGAVLNVTDVPGANITYG